MAQRILEARVISLAGSAARRAAVAANLSGFRYPWSFFDALSGTSPSPLQDGPEFQRSHFGRALGQGEIGCFKSHAALLADFVEHGAADWLLVLEDDVWIDTGFPFDGVLALAGAEAIHYLRLFARRFKPADVIRQLGGRQLIRFRTDPYGTQAYLIDREGARRFLATAPAISMPIDDALGRFWHHGLDPYAIFPFPVVECGTSLIEEGRSGAQAAPPRPDLARRTHQARAYVAKRLYNFRYRLSRSRRR